MPSIPFRRPNVVFGRYLFPAVRLGSLADALKRQIEVERAARSGYALLPLGMMLGIAFVLGSGMRPDGTLSFLVAAGLLLASWLMGGRPLAAAALLGASVAIGISVAGAELRRTSTVVLSGDATVRILGPVLEREEDERGRFRYTVRIDSTDRPVLSRPPGRARILVSSRHEALAIGQIYRGLVRLRPPAGPAYPGGYDFAYTPFFDGLGAYGFSLGAPEVGTETMTLGWRSAVADLRLRMDERIREALPGPEGAVASALITGLRGAIPEDIDESFRVTGLAHVLSISGFHMALVAGFVMIGVRTLLALVPAVALRFSTKKIAAVCALAVATFYYLLSGDNAATERSFVMIAVMLGAVLIDRPAITLRNVGFAAIVVMASSPHVVLTATFQMSFAATVALVGIYGAVSHAGTPRGRRTGRSLAAAVGLVLLGLTLSSVIAGAATAPFSIYHFQRAAPYGLLANLVATPIFTFWVMPAGLAVALTMPLGLDGPFLALMGIGLKLVFTIARVLAEAFPDVATGPISTLSVLMFSAAILVGSLLASRLRWLCVPIAIAAICVVPAGARPELLIFEDGRELALLTADGSLTPLRDRPNKFVNDQWVRNFGGPAAHGGGTGFECEDDVCRATTNGGHRVAWTDDYEKLGLVCDTADIAVVARAVRATECRSGAALVTLRTLRRTGSLALSTSSEGGIVVSRSVPVEPEEWNRHRHASWPEAWRRPETDETAGRVPPAATPNDTGGSVPPVGPEP